MYENHRILMGFLSETAFPIPKPFFTAAEFTLNLDIQRAFGEEINVEKIQNILKGIRKLNVPVDGASREFIVRHKMGGRGKKFCLSTRFWPTFRWPC